MAEKVTVINPTTGAPMDVSACVVEVPCPQCHAPLGVPCRGARWDSPDRKVQGSGNSGWWWRSTHWGRGDLASGIRRNLPQAWIDFHEATINATMEPCNTWGTSVDIDEAEFEDLVEKSDQAANPPENEDDELL